MSKHTLKQKLRMMDAIEEWESDSSLGTPYEAGYQVWVHDEDLGKRRYFKCTLDHFPFSSTAPLFGSQWRQYWQELSWHMAGMELPLRVEDVKQDEVKRIRRIYVKVGDGRVDHTVLTGFYDSENGSVVVLGPDGYISFVPHIEMNVDYLSGTRAEVMHRLGELIKDKQLPAISEVIEDE